MPKNNTIFKGEFSDNDPQRILRITNEFTEGFDVLSKVKNAVSIFGSARVKPQNKYYKKAFELSFSLAKQGYGIITGGGPGIMEAANKGAKKACGHSIGLNILLPSEQKPNPYIDTKLNFRYFFCRKVMFVKYTKAAVFFPGGFGTMDEFFEVITLIQTKRINKIPVVLIGNKYWKYLTAWIKSYLLKENFIESKDIKMFHITDQIDKATEIIKKFYKKNENSYN